MARTTPPVNGHRVTAAPVITIGRALDDLFACSNLPTIPTPFTRLNDALGGGLIAGQSVVLPGATGSGKSSLLATIATFVAATAPVVIGTYELPARIFVARMGAQLLDERWLDIIRGRVPRAALERVIPGSIEFLQRPPIDVLERSIKSAADREGQAPLVLLDYLQIMMSVTATDDPRVATAKTSELIRELADATKAPILLAAAVSRQNSQLLRQAKRTAQPSDLAGVARDVSNVEYDAAAVLALAVSPEVDDQTGLQRAILAVSKNRFGPSDIIGLQFHGRSGRWFESSVSLEPTEEERDEQRERVLTSLRHSKQPLPKHRIFARDGKKWVEGRTQELVKLVDDMVEEGLVELVPGPRHPRFRLPDPRRQLSVPGTVGNDGNSRNN